MEEQKKVIVFGLIGIGSYELFSGKYFKASKRLFKKIKDVEEFFDEFKKLCFSNEFMRPAKEDFQIKIIEYDLIGD